MRRLKTQGCLVELLSLDETSTITGGVAPPATPPSPTTPNPLAPAGLLVAYIQGLTGAVQPGTPLSQSFNNAFNQIDQALNNLNTPSPPVGGGPPP